MHWILWHFKLHGEYTEGSPMSKFIVYCFDLAHKVCAHSVSAALCPGVIKVTEIALIWGHIGENCDFIDDETHENGT